MNIEYMREFVLLSEFKNFTAVANTTYISQPTLSRHISMLEDEVGAQLLERTKHKVELTLIGKVVYEECVQILKAYDGMLNRVSVLTEGIQGIVFILWQKRKSMPLCHPIIRWRRKSIFHLIS